MKPFVLTDFIPTAQQQWMVGMCLGGAFIGWIVEHWLLKPFSRFAQYNGWPVQSALTKALDGYPILWGFFLGCYLTIFELPLKNETHDHINRILQSLIILSIILVALRALKQYWLIHQSSDSDDLTVQQSSSFIQTLFKYLIILLGLLAIFQTLGISVLPVLAALGVGGIAISLALQDPLSNLFAGIQLLLSKQVRIGQFIRLSTDEEGTIIDINLRNTTLRRLNNNLIIIPNQKFATSIVTNFDCPDPHFGFGVTIPIAYTNKLHDVEALCIEVARRVLANVEGSVREYEPLVRMNPINETSLGVTVNLQATQYRYHFLLKHEATKQLIEAFQTNGIQMAPAPSTPSRNGPP